MPKKKVFAGKDRHAFLKPDYALLLAWHCARFVLFGCVTC
jgi:hypothetical protein